VDGQPAEQNSFADTSRLLAFGKSCPIRITVAPSRVVVESRGRRIIDARDLSRLKLMNAIVYPVQPRIGFFLPLSPSMKVRKLRLTPSSDGGRPLTFTAAGRDLDRRLAELVVWKGGRVRVDSDDCTLFEDLPEKPFRVAGIHLHLLNQSLARELRRVGELEQLTELRVFGSSVDDEDVVSFCKARGLRQLEVLGDSVTDAGLEHVGRLSQLEVLNLGAPEMTDVGLKALAQLTQVHTLRLSSSKITGAAFADFQEVSNLRTLTVEHCDSWSDAGCAALRRFPALETLHMIFTRPSADGIKSISQIPNLKTLNVDYFPSMSAEWLAPLVDAPRLTSLSLAGATVTDPMAEALARLSQLESLALYDSRIRDSGLEHLHKLQSLRELHLYHAKPITESALARLKSALPNCRILR
jgi:Leucine-rich repeat (LRR) protein